MKSLIAVLILGAAIIGFEAWYFDKHPRPTPPPPAPELVTTAPDGTKLWRISDKGEWVYFSTAGASWETRRPVDGDGNTRAVKHTTPNANR